MPTSTVKTQLLLIFVIMSITTLGIWFLFSSKQAPITQTVKPIAPLVHTQRVAPETLQLHITGFGTLEPWQHIQVRAQVGGEVVDLPPSLQPGKTFNKHQWLAQIDPSEYEHLLEQERANLARAELALKEEEGRQQVAEREWKLLAQKTTHRQGDTQNNALRQSRQHLELALRTAHLKERASALTAAHSAVKLAERRLQRATLKAPCDGVILNTDLALGQVISANAVVAEYACMAAMRLIISLPENQLRHLPRWPNGESLPANVEQQPAQALYLLPQLAADTQQQQVLLRIPHNADATHLRIGQYVQASIAGKTYPHVYKIPKEALRRDNYVWLLTETNTLARKRLQILQSTEHAHLAIEPSIAHQAHATQEAKKQNPKPITVITSIIDAPYVGMPLRAAATSTTPSE